MSQSRRRVRKLCSLDDLAGLALCLRQLSCQQAGQRFEDRPLSLLAAFRLIRISRSKPAYTKSGRETVDAQLTRSGIRFFQRLAASVLIEERQASAMETPSWNRRTRELRIGTALVKRFARPGPNQELLLQAFEESGWPDEIDDPLSQCNDVIPAQRLRETVKRLNRSLTTSSLRFGTSAGGRRATWHG